MRALLDANVYISYLLRSAGEPPPTAAFEAAVTGAYSLLMTARIATEVRGRTEAKPYLSARITSAQVDRLIDLIGRVAETMPEVAEPFPTLGRDRKDDYLYAHAVLGQADYLVSGDKGVLDVRQIGKVQIVSPTEFVQILGDSGLI